LDGTGILCAPALSSAHHDKDRCDCQLASRVGYVKTGARRLHETALDVGAARFGGTFADRVGLCDFALQELHVGGVVTTV
jgi:hypothetical protein